MLHVLQVLQVLHVLQLGCLLGNWWELGQESRPCQEAG